MDKLQEEGAKLTEGITSRLVLKALKPNFLNVKVK